MLAALEKAFPDPSLGVRWTRPQGGLFLWVSLPEGIDTADLLKEAVKEKVAFVPGAPFFPGGGGRNTHAAELQQRDMTSRSRRGSRASAASSCGGAQGSACGSRVAQGFSPRSPSTLQ